VSTDGIPVGFSGRKLALLAVCVALVGWSVVWSFLSMRAVMAVGGACADGGPYVSAQPCPAGGGLIGLAVPVLVLATIGGSIVAAALPAPLLFVPMWAFLFGALGWNFLDSGFGGQTGTTSGWIVCGVLFELMAAPAFVVLALGLAGRSTFADGGSPPMGSGRWWWFYPLLGTLGVVVGLESFYAVV
jgi:hypothetical protein